MFNVNWINCISHCFILKYIMYSTNPTNPGEDFIYADSLFGNPFSLEIDYCLNKKYCPRS